MNRCGAPTVKAERVSVWGEDAVLGVLHKWQIRLPTCKINSIGGWRESDMAFHDMAVVAKQLNIELPGQSEP